MMLSTRRLLETQMAELKNQLKSPIREIEEACVHAEIERAHIATEEVRTKAKKATEKVLKLKKTAELQTNQINQLEQELKKLQVAIKLSQEEATEAKDESQSYREEKTKIETELVASHSQQGDLRRDLCEEVAKRESLEL